MPPPYTVRKMELLRFCGRSNTYSVATGVSWSTEVALQGSSVAGGRLRGVCGTYKLLGTSSVFFTCSQSPHRLGMRPTSMHTSFCATSILERCASRCAHRCLFPLSLPTCVHFVWASNSFTNAAVRRIAGLAQTCQHLPWVCADWSSKLSDVFYVSGRNSYEVYRTDTNMLQCSVL